MTSPRPRYLELLETLTGHHVDFIVVGGVAAILEGVPITTLDLDVLADLEPPNRSRLLQALRELGAVYRDPAGRRFEPTDERLATFRVNLFTTRLGPLDVLAEVAGQPYAQLLADSRPRRVAGIEVRVLGLAKLIESKELADRDKDRAMLPVMRQTLIARRDRGD